MHFSASSILRCGCRRLLSLLFLLHPNQAPKLVTPICLSFLREYYPQCRRTRQDRSNRLTSIQNVIYTFLRWITLKAHYAIELPCESRAAGRKRVTIPHADDTNEQLTSQVAAQSFAVSNAHSLTHLLTCWPNQLATTGERRVKSG